MKTHHEGQYDLLVLGDSRVYRGVSPADMSQALPGWRSFNLGYSSAGFGPLMYEEAARRLDPEGARVLVLGITPWSLTESAAQNAHLQQELARPLSERWQRRYVNYYLQDLAPTRPEALWQALRGTTPAPAEYYYQTFDEAGGWMPSRLEPPQPRKALGPYRAEFRQEQVSPARVEALLDQVQTWVAEGVSVYAFRPPTSPDMTALEDELSGLDMSALGRDIEAAGGIWLDIPGEYPSYDGSHLPDSAARRFSRALGAAIAAQR
ncbi:MAG: hypothetical protein D6722_08565 [Bacteroidetes bacterium]|nr:MAG: hypothetical protein D6722_08565 [Bacteroidota bacterium]